MRPETSISRLTSDDVTSLRPQISRPAAGDRPLDVIDEREASQPNGTCVSVRTLFLRGSECRFHCVMCDLWQFTHKADTPLGAITEQIRFGLDAPYACADAGGQRPRWLKLYNASSFFDSKNVPPSELPDVAALLSRFDRVIVENHPRMLPWATICDFQQRLTGQLEIAMGLETIEPVTLARLNKRMTAADFSEAARGCRERGIDVRAFVLLRPPWMNEGDALNWCRHSIDFAIAQGARHVSVIPTRSGNGTLEWLQARGEFEPPLASSLEIILQEYVAHKTCIVTADLWNWQQLRGLCAQCSPGRRERLQRMNLKEAVEPFTACECRHA